MKICCHDRRQDGKQGGKSSARQWARIFLRKTRRKILCSPMGSHFSPKNKEENPLLANGLAFFSEKQGGKSSARQWARIFLRKTRRKILCSCKGSRIFLRKTRRKILCSPMGSHFPSENKEDWDEEVRDYYQT